MLQRKNTFALNFNSIFTINYNIEIYLFNQGEKNIITSNLMYLWRYSFKILQT